MKQGQTLKELTAKTARDIVVRPIITEKSIANAQLSKYTFEVNPSSNKIEIRKAIEEIFKVTVMKVTTTTMRGKKRVRMDKKGRHQGLSKSWKKATVSLKDGEKIEMAGFNPFEV